MPYKAVRKRPILITEHALSPKDALRNDCVIQFSLKMNAILKQPIPDDFLMKFSSDFFKPGSGENPWKAFDTFLKEYFEDKTDSVEFDLDLNPYSKIFEQGEDILKPGSMKAAFLSMILLVKYLKALEDKKNANVTNEKLKERVARIIYNRNSPAETNVSFSSAYNGDMKPPYK